MSIIVYNSESLHIQYPEEYLTMLFGEHKLSDLEPVTSDDVRAMFALAISQMYQKEVPQYGTLLEIVSEVNKHGTSNGSTYHGDTESRVEVERHGAIRLGTPEELSMMRRLLAVLGMEPVDYYDLTAAGIPVHATGFRPIAKKSLERNPFRVFTSLLRLDLIQDKTLRTRVAEILARRQIFTPQCVVLIKRFESGQALSSDLAKEFIREALETFRWHSSTTVDINTYQAIQAEHPLIADVACFRGPHINHLTPRVRDIDAAQTAMQERGLATKATIEGPPRRDCPILLRQTSFLALEEEVVYISESSMNGKHKARFGEIEQRGMALTPKGRRLYDELLDRSHVTVMQVPEERRASSQSFLLRESFQEFPDDLETIHKERLAYFTYRISNNASEKTTSTDIDSMVNSGLLIPTPITYEDFLPISAAGIFHSNLGESDDEGYAVSPDQAAFERSLGCTVHNSIELYSQMEKDSISYCLKVLNVGRL